MLKLLKILKIIIAFALLGAAYLFLTEQSLFGFRPIVIGGIISVIGGIVLFADFQLRRNSRKSK